MWFSLEKIAPRRLLEGNQPYGFSLRLRELGLWDERWPAESLEQAGMLTPVLVKKAKDSPGGFHILDGFKRLFWADSAGMPAVSCLLTAPGLSLEDCWLAVLSAHKEVLGTTAIKAVFLETLDRSGVPRETTTKRFMPLLGLGPSDDLLRKYLRIARLPASVLVFCHQKRLSAKRCLNLTHHKRGLLEHFFARSSSLSLSASLTGELLDNINDILRRDDLSPEDFFSSPEMVRILEGETDIRTRTRRFRQAVRNLRFPVLTKIEREMEHARKRFLSDRPFSVSWDRALENRAVNLTALVRSPEEFLKLVQALEEEDTLKGIEAILSHL